MGSLEVEAGGVPWKADGVGFGGFGRLSKLWIFSLKPLRIRGFEQIETYRV